MSNWLDSEYTYIMNNATPWIYIWWWNMQYHYGHYMELSKTVNEKYIGPMEST